MAVQVDLVEFVVPVENNKTVFVWNIEPSQTHADVYRSLHAVFSSFGPLYLLKVFPLSPAGFYGLVKFYSAAHAAAAQRRTDGRSLFQSSPLKVRLSSKQTPHFLSDGRPLSHARCLELANHCLGFNGWTSDIITMKELTNEEEEEDGEVRRRLRFGCLLQLSFPRHGQNTRGAAAAEHCFTCTGPDVLIQQRRRLQRLVTQKALIHAFSSVLLILLADGKVMVELKQTSDQFIPEHTEGVLQVNEVNWTDCPDEDDDDDEEWDLTVS
ncbi:RAD52 motif-containing protein 1 [Scomber japonicus]|uniref:RAD52 motif-containing protein 1 n=1 Tax=Scomber japonicus TaxID=13676 RepID=UPI002306A39C|nr:RAD52 motif-containing protein 1 [Scomber japonicus]XP_053194590.1 RAD52 motif-containing protein 1 [Scomber japonicus]